MSGTAERSVVVPGFWRACWTHKWRILRGGKPWVSLVAGVVPAVLLPGDGLKDTLASLAGAELGVAAALFGVVLAGMAVIVVFLSQEYLQLLAQLPDPVARFERILFPFWFAAGLTVGAIFWDILILLVDALATDTLRRVILAGSTWFITWSLLEVMAVVALISGHGANRARQILKGQGQKRER
jgi:hypothetical protein